MKDMMGKCDVGVRNGNGMQRSRLGVKAAAAIATLSLVASMCPGVAALAFANGQLAAGSGDLQAQGDGDGQVSAQAETAVDSDTHEMPSGTYHVTSDVTIRPGDSGNGIRIKEGAEVTLVIDAGVTLTVYGSYANTQGPGRAAILLPESSKLLVKGSGTLRAVGGGAGVGSNGGNAQKSYREGNVYGEEITGFFYTGEGGKGGRGGDGAGAGIGTDGGKGGNGGWGAIGIKCDANLNENRYGWPGKPGEAGSAAKPAGTLTVEDAITVIAEGGTGAAGGAGGGRGWYVEDRDANNGIAAGTSGGGGGGGGGSAANGIGAGGSGGGGGGGGASANIDGEFVPIFGCDLDDLWGHGGAGGASAWGGGNGATGDEGASNGGDDTGASRKYARPGGAGGACPEPAKGAYTCEEGSGGDSPTVILGSYEYDGKPHGATVGTTVSNGAGSVKYYKADSNEELASAPTEPGSYTVTLDGTAGGSSSFGYSIVKRQVQKPAAEVLAFECADLQTGEGAEQSAFAKLSTGDYEFDANAVAADGAQSTSAASAAGSYRTCFKLKDPATCQWAGESDDAEAIWVPWSISAQEIDPNDVTYWGPAYDNATTTVTYTGSPVWVRPWYAPARASDGELPAWLGSFGTDRDSALVVYRQGDDDPAGLVGYHENSDGSLEPVTAAQVLAWRNGVDVNGQHVDVQSGDTVWYKTDSDGKATALAVQSAAPDGADGSYVARDLSYVTHLGVKDPGTYQAIALVSEGEGFALTARPTATVEVVAPAKEAATKAAPSKASSSPKTGDFDPSIIGGVAIVALLAAGALALSRRRAEMWKRDSPFSTF